MVVYFVQAVDGGPVKIGFTDDVDRRIGQLESRYGRKLAILATMPGGRPEERKIHARFSHLRFGRREQFRPDSDLLTFIGYPVLVAANPNTAEVMPHSTEAVRLRADVAAKARVAAAFEGQSILDYLSDILDPILTKAINDSYARMNKDSAKPKKKSDPPAPER